VLGVAGGYYYWHTIAGLFQRKTLNLTAAAGGAMNVLIVGSDTREGITTPEDIHQFGTVGGHRSDTLILAQLVPREQRGVLISIPRDSWVTVHHEGRSFEGKINSAYQYGPQAVIDTVYALTGVPINHYVEVNFIGFRRMVDSLGGIDVCNQQSFNDPVINFSLSAGEHHLTGNQALQYVRTRHATADGDFGRIKRQQEFFRAVMAKVGRPAVLGNPLRVNSLATAFAQNVTVDQFFRLPDLVRLALSLRRAQQNQLETYSVPARVGHIGGQSVVFVDNTKAEPLFAALRSVRSPASLMATPAPPVQRASPAKTSRAASAPPRASTPATGCTPIPS
jgi:LCP family protein required for cell wall assembly